MPELSNLHYGPLTDIRGFEESSISSLDTIDTPEELPKDVWTEIRLLPLEKSDDYIKSWDSFRDRGAGVRPTALITEAGSKSFDALLALASNSVDRTSSQRRVGTIIQTSAVLSSLLRLAMGRESVLYKYEKDERAFHPRKDDIRMSGYSLEIYSDFSRSLLDHGNRVAQLRDASAAAYERPPAMVALLIEIAKILASLESTLLEAVDSVRSLLQLKSIVDFPIHIVRRLQELQERAQSATSEHEAVSLIFESITQMLDASPKFCAILIRLLNAATRPWRVRLKQALGLDHNAFGVLSSSEADGQGPLQLPEHLPSFVSDDDAALIEQTRESLVLLRRCDPNSLQWMQSSSDLCSSDAFEWQSTLEGCGSVSVKAMQYESRLRNALRDSMSTKRPQNFRKSLRQSRIAGRCQEPPSSPALMIRTTTASFEGPLEGKHLALQEGPSDDLAVQLMPPPSALFAMSFVPTIRAQARVADRAILRLFFHSYDLRSHLSLLHRHYLLADGPFVSQLSDALFDAPTSDAERSGGRRGSKQSGLRLGHRDTWPPRLSELRLSLMGILTETYWGEWTRKRSFVGREDLPGGLSFAIREMSEDELKRCSDPNSIEALDFLKLQYQAPAPLDSIITQKALSGYDNVFKMLLRVRRVHFVVNHLPRARSRVHDRIFENLITRFRIETHHFVSSICAYMFDGIGVHWRRLMHQMINAESSIDDPEQTCGNFHNLCEAHENMLERIMTTMFLRKSQSTILVLLEQIFGMILLFARRIGDGREVMQTTGTIDVMQDLYGEFRRKVDLFVEACRGMSQQPGLGGTRTIPADGEDAGENATGQLLLRLEMNDFYVPLYGNAI